MREIVALAILLAAVPTQAADRVSVSSEVYLERSATQDGKASRLVEPAPRFARGDKVVTILSWPQPPSRGLIAISAVPGGLALESASRGDMQVSMDGGRSWRKLAENGRVPRGITHIRWQLGAREGKLSYRALVL